MKGIAVYIKSRERTKKFIKGGNPMNKKKQLITRLNKSPNQSFLKYSISLIP
jgi:hypothetical protein